MNENKCLYCYESLLENEIDFHKKCSKSFFGTDKAPIVSFGNDELNKIAQNLVNRRQVVTGVQPKLSLSIEPLANKQSRLTIVGVMGKYILKPQTQQFEEVPQNESLIMKIAQEMGIKTAQNTLIRLVNGELAYLTKRFDRSEKDKIHVQDFCQITDTLTEYKYRSSMEKVGKAIKKYSANAGFDALRFWELSIFNFLVGNTDMHLKNFSLLENQSNEWVLSPAYDLLSTKIIMPEDKEETALTINGKKNKLKRADFEELANSLGISSKTQNSIFEHFFKNKPLMLNWIEKSFLSEEKKQELMELITQKLGELSF